MHYTAQKVQGVAHWYNRRQPCEDASMVRSLGGVSVAAICDGASCCIMARETAQALCRAVTLLVLTRMRSLMRMTNEEIRQMILRCIREVQRGVMAQYGCTLMDCGCTLSLAAADSVRGTYLAVQLGDGAVIGQRAGDGALFQLTRPDKGQSAHATWLTVHTDREIMQHLQIARGSGLDGFFCTSDGLEGIFYAADGDVAPELSGVLHALRRDSDAGRRLIENIARSPAQPDDDVSFAAMAASARRPAGRAAARMQRQMPCARKYLRVSAKPKTLEAVQLNAGLST